MHHDWSDDLLWWSGPVLLDVRIIRINGTHLLTSTDLRCTDLLNGTHLLASTDWLARHWRRTDRLPPIQHFLQVTFRYNDVFTHRCNMSMLLTLSLQWYVSISSIILSISCLFYMMKYHIHHFTTVFWVQVPVLSFLLSKMDGTASDAGDEHDTNLDQ